MYGLPLCERERVSLATRVLNIILGVMIALLAGFLLFNHFVVVCAVEGSSMSFTLLNGETILLERRFDKIERGDIVTISGMSERLIVKRVIALEGDRLVFARAEDNDGYVELYLSKEGGEFIRLNEEYIRTRMTIFGWGLVGENRVFRDEYQLAPAGAQLDDFAITLGKGECFVLGDNRGDSRDSRYYGAGKLDNVRGKMFFKVPKNSLLEKILLYLYRENEHS